MQSRGLVALNTLKKWDKLAGDPENKLWDLGGMRRESTFRGCIFGQYLESTLDYVLADIRTMNRWVRADTI